VNESRFESGESLPWDKKSFKEGVRARKQGRTIQSNPYQGGTRAAKSWSAGWADEDQNLNLEAS
jgi:hypothetical protein